MRFYHVKFHASKRLGWSFVYRKRCENSLERTCYDHSLRGPNELNLGHNFLPLIFCDSNFSTIIPAAYGVSTYKEFADWYISKSCTACHIGHCDFDGLPLFRRVITLDQNLCTDKGASSVLKQYVEMTSNCNWGWEISDASYCAT